MTTERAGLESQTEDLASNQFAPSYQDLNSGGLDC